MKALNNTKETIAVASRGYFFTIAGMPMINSRIVLLTRRRNNNMNMGRRMTIYKALDTSVIAARCFPFVQLNFNAPAGPSCEFDL